jgi:hypothetical protein
VQWAELNYCAGAVLGLQQAGHELDLVGADHRAGLFQAQVGLEPARQDVAVLAPPAGFVGARSQHEERVSFLLVSDAVQGQQISHVTRFKADPPQL